MLTRFLLPRGAAASFERLFATSIPRWNVPTAPLDADVIRAPKQMTAREFIQNARKEAQLKARKERKNQLIVKRKEIRAQRLAQKVFRREQSAAQAERKSAEAKPKRAEVLKAHRERKQQLLAKCKEIRAQVRAQAASKTAEANAKRAEVLSAVIAKRKKIKEQAAARAASKTAEAQAAAALEKAKKAPWHKHGKLPSRPLGVYMEQQLASDAIRDPGEKISDAKKRIGAQFKALTPEQCRPYEETAAVNLKVREAALAKIQGLKVTPYFFFVKDNYQNVADGLVDGKGVAKALAAKYKALSPEERAPFEAKADGIRAEAQKNLAEMA